MCPRLIEWLLRRRDRPGQGLVEFAIAVPVFLLFVFGIIQAVLIYKAYVAVNQAATDAVHILAAQSSSGALNGAPYTQADSQGLAAIRIALTSQDLSKIASIDIASVASDGTVKHAQVTSSSDFSGSGTFTTPQDVRLDNQYSVTQPTSGAQRNCKVDQFWLTNALSMATTPPFQQCAPPWDGSSWANALNDNGRHDTRCDEDVISVTIKYHYVSASFPVNWDLTLTGQDSTTLEPRQFMGNAGTQQAIATC